MITQLRRGALLLALFLPLAGFAQETKRSLVFLGDSITAGYGVDQNQAYPALVEEKMGAAHLPYEAVNAGVSGDTTAGGLRRLDWLLQRKIDVLVIALGGNDGLRGIEPGITAANLQAMVDKVKARSPETKIVLAGMQIPPNLGADYTRRFQQVFPTIAARDKLLLIPFLLEGVGGRRELNQADLIHPNAAGHRIIAETVWRVLAPILKP